MAQWLSGATNDWLAFTHVVLESNPVHNLWEMLVAGHTLTLLLKGIYLFM